MYINISFCLFSYWLKNCKTHFLQANPNPPKDDWWAENAFEILAFCYQVWWRLSFVAIWPCDFGTFGTSMHFAAKQTKSLTWFLFRFSMSACNSLNYPGRIYLKRSCVASRLASWFRALQSLLFKSGKITFASYCQQRIDSVLCLFDLILLNSLFDLFGVLRLVQLIIFLALSTTFILFFSDLVWSVLKQAYWDLNHTARNQLCNLALSSYGNAVTRCPLE